MGNPLGNPFDDRIIILNMPVTVVEEPSRIRNDDIQPASSKDRAQDNALPQTGDDGLATLVSPLALVGAVVLAAGVVAKRRQSRHEAPR